MKTPDHIRVADELRERIQKGAVRRGDALPVESALKEEFGVTQRAVREALGILRAEGLIGGRTGGPLIVRKAVLFQELDLMIPFSVWVRSLGREPGGRTLEKVMRGADQLVAEQLGLSLRSAVLHYRRLRTIDGEPVMIEEANYPERPGRILQAADLDRDTVTEALAARGIEFGEAAHRVEAVPALARDAELLGVVRRTPLLLVRRRSYDVAGEPLEFGIDRYRGDLFGLVLHSRSRFTERSHP